MAAPNVPFKRILKVGDTGDDVKAIKIITSRAGCWPWGEFDNVASDKFMHGYGSRKNTQGLEGMQKLLKVAADGVYGPMTHKASLPFRVPKGLAHAGEYIWDGHSQALYKGGRTGTAESIVADIFNWWDWMVAREPQIHYSQIRPMPELARHHEPPVLPYSEDCSSTFIYCAFLGGALSPDPYGFSGYGNTNSLVKNGINITRDQIAAYCRKYYIGAFYGASIWNTHHVSAVKDASHVYSMGNERAPERWPNVDYMSQLVALKAYRVV